MKEYRLTSWPDLPSEYQHTRYQRVLHDMSQRFMSVKQLTASSSLRRGELRAFMHHLASQKLVDQRHRGGWASAFAERLSGVLLGPLRWLGSR